MQRHGLQRGILGAVEVIEPAPVFDLLTLQKHAAAVLTDSGCVQEEAYMLQVPCVTIRDNTERPLTVLNGANELTGYRPASIRDAVRRAIARTDRTWPELYGKPGVGVRIVQRILGITAQSGLGLTSACPHDESTLRCIPVPASSSV